ncbi:hypothetical protein C0J52_09628 [Blattella germanica]|nr:hypothetical protein C0J52_09628 [Blattella germanica]
MTTEYNILNCFTAAKIIIILTSRPLTPPAQERVRSPCAPLPITSSDGVTTYGGLKINYQQYHMTVIQLLLNHALTITVEEEPFLQLLKDPKTPNTYNIDLSWNGKHALSNTLSVLGSAISCSSNDCSRVRRGFRLPLRGLEITIPVSDIPNRSNNLCPETCSQRLKRGTGSGAEPLTISLEK